MREILWEILKIKGMHEDDIKFIQNMYTEAQVSMITDLGTTKPVKLEKGLRQGCPLSCLLFNIYIDGVVRLLKDLKTGINMPGNIYKSQHECIRRRPCRISK